MSVFTRFSAQTMIGFFLFFVLAAAPKVEPRPKYKPKKWTGPPTLVVHPSKRVPKRNPLIEPILLLDDRGNPVSTAVVPAGSTASLAQSDDEVFHSFFFLFHVGKKWSRPPIQCLSLKLFTHLSLLYPFSSSYFQFFLEDLL